MIGIDTNVLVRYFVKDDEAQFLRAQSLVEKLTVEEPGFVTLVTLAELVWVLERGYRTAKVTIIRIIETLLELPRFVLEQAETVEAALRVFSQSQAGFSDVLIERSAHDAGCAYTLTFDEKAVRNAGMQLVP